MSRESSNEKIINDFDEGEENINDETPPNEMEMNQKPTSIRSSMFDDRQNIRRSDELMSAASGKTSVLNQLLTSQQVSINNSPSDRKK